MAPRCLWREWRRSTESTEGTEGAEAGEGAWLGLEEVTDAYGGWWPPARTLLAARHLGAFNGAFLNRVPDVAWLGRSYLRQRIERASPRLPLFEDHTTWGHARLRQHFEPVSGELVPKLVKSP